MEQRTHNDAGSGVLTESAPDASLGWRPAVLAGLERWHLRSLWVSIGITVVVGVASVVHLGTTLHFSDEHGYVAIADNLARHGRFSLDGVHPTAYRAPGWPLLLAPVRWLGGGILAFRLVNVALAAMVVALGWWLARVVGGKPVAALAAPVLALYPVAVYTEGTLYPETLASVLLLAGLAAAVEARRSAGPLRWAAAAGGSFGALILTVPNAWIPLAATLAWLALGTRRLWRVAGCVLLVAAAVVSVWVVRNALTMHEFIPVTDASGYNLLLANSEHATVRSGVATDLSQYWREAGSAGSLRRPRWRASSVPRPSTTCAAIPGAPSSSTRGAPWTTSRRSTTWPPPPSSPPRKTCWRFSATCHSCSCWPSGWPGGARTGRGHSSGWPSGSTC